MAPHIPKEFLPKEFLARLIDWSPFAVTMPPRDPDEDREDDEEEMDEDDRADESPVVREPDEG
jgi:hypothetical protein